MEEKDYTKRLKEHIEKEFSFSFLQSRDKQIAYLTGMYYNKAVYRQQSVFGTRSLIKRLPITSKKINKENIIKMLDECNIVMRKIASANKEKPFVPYAQLREQIFDLLKEIDSWDSSPYELNVAFQMGYDSYIE